MIHETCEVHSNEIDETAKIWNRTQIMECVQIARCVSIGRDCFIGKNTRIGEGSKIQNACQIFGAVIGERVLISPRVVMVEDPWPRAFEVCVTYGNKEKQSFNVKPVIIEDEASIGAGSVIVPGVKIGRQAMVAAGSVVLSDVPPNTLVAGNPARAISEVCRCGRRTNLCSNESNF